MKSYILLVSAFAALLVSCGESAPADPHAGHNHAPGEHPTEETAADPHAGHNHAPGEHPADEAEPTTTPAAGIVEIVLEPAQAQELGVEFAIIEPAEFIAAIHTSGTIEATPGDNASIAATASGVVNFGGRKTVEGSPIAKGATLLTINSSTMTDDNLSMRIADAGAQLAKAAADFERIEKLYKIQMATAQSMEDARLALSTAKQTVQTLNRSTTDGSRSVKSSIGGYITSLAVKDGDYVTQGQALATVSSTRTVVLKADLPARYFDKLTLINSANFSTPYNDKTYDIDQMGARKLATARSTTDYSLPIRFEIENRDNLVAGSIVDVYLKTAAVQNIISVPLTALTEEQGAFYVYIKLDAECYVKRSVKIGDSNGIRQVILHGVKAGETVVTKGAYFVRLASMSGAIPDGHNH